MRIFLLLTQLKLTCCPKQLVTTNILNECKEHAPKETLPFDTGKWIRDLFHAVITSPLYTSAYVHHCRHITASVLFYHNVNKSHPLISSNIVIRGPAWTCYSTNICGAMHHVCTNLTTASSTTCKCQLPYFPLTFISNGQHELREISVIMLEMDRGGVDGCPTPSG